MMNVGLIKVKRHWGCTVNCWTDLEWEDGWTHARAHAPRIVQEEAHACLLLPCVSQPINDF